MKAYARRPSALALADAFDRMDSQCVETTWSRNHHNYGQSSRGGKRWYAHRWAWTQAHGPIPDGLHVLHHCDNPPCVKTEPDERFPDGHLYVGTHADNMADRSRRGRHAPSAGEANPAAVLTEANVREVRQRHDSGEDFKSIARALALPYAAVWCAGRRRTWRHVA